MLRVVIRRCVVTVQISTAWRVGYVGGYRAVEGSAVSMGVKEGVSPTRNPSGSCYFVVLTFLTRIIKSVVTGQAPVTLELRNTLGIDEAYMLRISRYHLSKLISTVSSVNRYDLCPASHVSTYRVYLPAPDALCSSLINAWAVWTSGI